MSHVEAGSALFGRQVLVGLVVVGHGLVQRGRQGWVVMVRCVMFWQACSGRSRFVKLCLGRRGKVYRV